VLSEKARVLSKLLPQFGVTQVTEVACVPLRDLLDEHEQLGNLALSTEASSILDNLTQP
jgi:hypothetical protein